MTGHGAKFGRKQEEAIAALLSHRSIEDAAQAINVAPRTLLRWLQVPEFRAAYLKARREAVGQSIARMQQATGAAAITVLKLMTDPNVPAAVKLRAAECVFALEDIETRLTELERNAKPLNNGRRS
jgi:hypothetical protein